MTLKSGTILSLALASISMTAVAADPMAPKTDVTRMEHHQSMDINRDGMLSKEEFMSHHEKMWDDMKKTTAGLVDVKSMTMGGDKKCGAEMKEKAKS